MRTTEGSPRAGTVLPVQVRLRGAFPDGTAELARSTIAALVARVGEPVRAVRVRVGVHRDPAVHFPVVAQGNVDLVGRPVRAQVNAATAREAIAALRDRLRLPLQWVGVLPPEPGSPESRLLRSPPKPWVVPYPRPPRLRRVVRHKPWQLTVCGVDRAVWDMECRDYDFHLFTEVGTGQDSVVFRAGRTGYRLAQLSPQPDCLARHSVPLTCYDRPAPERGTDQAAEQLGLCEVSFLFFRQTGSGRGAVLYRRWDGHYGLLGPPGRGAPGAGGNHGAHR